MLNKEILEKIKVWTALPVHRFQAVIWFLVAVLYYPVFKALYGYRWDSVDYSHAYFILPVAIFMGWHALKRARRSSLVASRLSDDERRKTNDDSRSSRSAALFPALFAFALLMFIFGWRQGYLSVNAFSIIPVLYGLIGWLYGPRVVRVLWFPIAYLLLMVPPPMGIIDSVTMPMRYGVSFATEHLVRLLGYPITRDGLMLSIGGNEVFLGEACSGFRSLITLSSLGFAYIFISKCSTPRKTVMAASIVPLALLGNLLRVMGVVIVTYYWGDSWGQKFFHDASGFVMFVVMLAGLLAIENLGKAEGVRRTAKEGSND